MKESKVLLIYGRTNQHLGLWDDLRKDSRVILRVAELKQLTWWKKILYRLVILFERYVTESRYKHFFYQYSDLFELASQVNHIVIIDGALNKINICELEKCRRLNSNVKFSLYLINSIKAQSPIMRNVRPKIGQFKWDNIFTFDEEDAKKYGYRHLGFNYYSAHNIDSVPNSVAHSDVFFVGGLKGGRTNFIYDIYSFLNSKKVICDFYLMPFGNQPVKELPGIYYYRGWRPYEDILEHVQQTNCIIEIMQEGQAGATLRYFEAVCMNKKLLTNNPYIASFPFYNPKWMRIFSSLEDIDMEWIRSREKIDYGYNGEFSPVHLIDYLLEDKIDPPFYCKPRLCKTKI